MALFTLSQLTPNEEAFLRNYAGVVHSQMSQLPQHNIDQGKTGSHAHTFLKLSNPLRSCCSCSSRKRGENPSTHLTPKEFTAQQTKQVPWQCMGTISTALHISDITHHTNIMPHWKQVNHSCQEKNACHCNFSVRKHSSVYMLWNQSPLSLVVGFGNVHSFI